MRIKYRNPENFEVHSFELKEGEYWVYEYNGVEFTVFEWPESVPRSVTCDSKWGGYINENDPNFFGFFYAYDHEEAILNGGELVKNCLKMKEQI